MGSPATPLVVTVTNGRAAGVQLLAAATHESVFPVSAGTIPRTIAGGGSTAVSVGFLPVASATVTDALTLTIDDAACPTVSVPVTGAGQTAGVQVSRSGADFGAVRVGTVSPPASFTVTNVGEAQFKISSISLSSADHYILELISPSGYPATLLPGDEVTFRASAKPTATGFQSAAVNVVTDIPGAGATQLALLTLGVAPDLEVSDERLDFGQVDVQGTAGVTRTLTLHNGGAVPLSVGEPAITGTDAGA